MEGLLKGSSWRLLFEVPHGPYNGKENGNYRNYRDHTGTILGLYWGYIGIRLGIVENKMETMVT